MTRIEFTGNYVTQAELSRAYRSLEHTPPVPSRWSAALLISRGLGMRWVCPVLHPPELREEHSAGHTWHVIAEAGELDWPPLRPESEIWPALLERDPVPTGDLAECQARFLSKNVEEMHRDNLRRHFLGDAHIGGMKRNPSDVNFDPAVRDWDATARELAAFLDDHRPPKLTTEQRVMEQGVRLAELKAEVASTKASLGRLMRNAKRDQGNQAGRSGFKNDMAHWGGVTRPTVDAWLSDSDCCEGAVPDEDGTTHTSHTHTCDNTQEQTR